MYKRTSHLAEYRIVEYILLKLNNQLQVHSLHKHKETFHNLIITLNKGLKYEYLFKIVLCTHSFLENHCFVKFESFNYNLRSIALLTENLSFFSIENHCLCEVQ